MTKPCKKCGQTERYPSGECKSCISRRNKEYQAKKKTVRKLEQAWASGTYAADISPVVLAVLHKRWAA